EASNTIAELEPQIAALHSCIQQGEELEWQVASLSGELREASNTIADLEQRSVSMDLVSNEIRARAAALEAERAHLKGELEKWRHSARHRGLLIEEIHHYGWVRLGLRLGAIKRCDIVPASLERPHPPSANWAGSAAGPGAGPKWELKVAEGSEAHAIYPDEDHEMVKVGITRARTKADW